jgi:hypothetical protein
MNILFATTSVVRVSEEELRLLYSTAKKKFLTEHTVEYVLFSDKEVSFDGVKVVKVETPHIQSPSYYQFLKVLNLNHVDLSKYDYVFVSDSDQMFVNDVTNDDILTNQLCILSHFYPEIKTKEHIHFWSDVVDINDSSIRHTMGNFFGGPSTIITDFLNFCNSYWDKYKNHNFNGTSMFSLYPEEVLLIKYIIENNIEEKRLSSNLYFDQESFLVNINCYGDLKANIKNFKVVHNTKHDLLLAEELHDIIKNN